MFRPKNCELKSLHDAIKSKNLDLLESLLKDGSDPNTADKKGKTALNFICSLTKLMKIDLEMIKLLLKYKADVNIPDKNCFSPIMNLFQFPKNYKLRLEVFKLLLENGADVTLIDYKSRTIFSNIILCNPTNPDTAVALELLLKSGGDPNINGNSGRTALHIICSHHEFTRVHLKMIEILLKYKADVNIQDKDGYTPIMNLIRFPENYKFRLEVFKLLLENGADVTLLDRGNDTILHLIFYCNAPNNPFILDAVELLFKIGIDVNVKNEYGYAALHVAAEYCRDIRSIGLLLKNCADPNIVDNTGRTALHIICSHHELRRFHLKMIQLLIQYGADVNTQDEDGFSPIVYLLCASKNYRLRLEVCKLLLDNGADVTLINNDGDTALHLLFKNNAEKNSIIFEAVEWLLKSEVDVNVKNNDGYSAIMLLYQTLRRDQGHMLELVKVLELMLKNGADVNIKDNIIYNETILHDAVYCTQPKHVAILLKYGADPNITDVNGKIPLNYIFKKCNKYVNYFLQEADLKTYLELLKLNVKYNADPCHVGGDGKTLLHSLIEEMSLFANIPEQADWKAVSKYVRKYIEVLLKHGFDINVKDRDGFTALNSAVSYCNYDIAKILVEHGADANTVQFKGGLLECRWIESSNLPNLLAIIKLWQSKGFQINSYQYLRIFKFLTLHQDFETNDDFYSWLFELCNSSRTYDRLALWFRHTYELGSGSLIRKLVEMLIRYDNSTFTNFDSGKIKKTLYTEINRYLFLIEYGNMYMDIETYNYLRNKLNLLVSENPEIEAQRIYQDIRDGVDLAKKMIISNNISFLDLCISSPDKTYYLLQKCDYESAINSADFMRNVDKIGGIIRGYIVKALVRRFIKQSTTDSVKLLFHGILPDLCWDKIIKFLDVIDLVSVYEAVINYKC